MISRVGCDHHRQSRGGRCLHGGPDRGAGRKTDAGADARPRRSAGCFCLRAARGDADHAGSAAPLWSGVFLVSARNLFESGGVGALSHPGLLPLANLRFEVGRLLPAVSAGSVIKAISRMSPPHAGLSSGRAIPGPCRRRAAAAKAKVWLGRRTPPGCLPDSADELADRLKLGMLSRAAPLKEHRLAGHEHAACRLESAERRLMIDCMPRGHRIDRDEHPPAGRE
ncbi:MAG: hypothetical protein RLZZ440_1634 [Planctomycetota bacterium]